MFTTHCFIYWLEFLCHHGSFKSLLTNDLEPLPSSVSHSLSQFYLIFVKVFTLLSFPWCPLCCYFCSLFSIIHSIEMSCQFSSHILDFLYHVFHFVLNQPFLFWKSFLNVYISGDEFWWDKNGSKLGNNIKVHFHPLSFLFLLFF